MNKVKLKNLKVTKKAVDNHKFVYNFLLTITFILFFPIVILQYLNDIFERIINIAINLRMKIVNTIFKILYKKEMRKED